MTDDIKPVYRDARPIGSPEIDYPGFDPSSTVLEEGSVHADDALPLPCDIRFDRDVALGLHDGTEMYVNVFRPPEATDVPVLVGWGPFGKDVSYLTLDRFPNRMGVPRDRLSGLQAWEAPDPAYWCGEGYAVVQPDPRGVFKSDGDIQFWGPVEARDGARLIEWLGARDWSNGRVGLTGNSWLAILQWFIAAERPTHLAAIAPWEGATDLYRHDVCEGGIPDPAFNDFIISHLYGENRVEDTPAMLEAYPLMNSYWEEKAADLESVEMPAYVVASYTNELHVRGTFRGFQDISSEEKWLRIHDSQEWPDYYDPENVEDLRRFFDYYLKGVDNGWKETPRVRYAVLDNGGKDEVGRSAEDFPPDDVEYTSLYLDARSGRLNDTTIDTEATVRYDAEAGGHTEFTYQFAADTELIGSSKLRMGVEAAGHDDMDLYVRVEKLDRRGNQRYHQIISAPFPLGDTILPTIYRLGRDRFDRLSALDALFWPGPKGQVRVSRRKTDPERSRPEWPVLAHTETEPLEPGEVVPVDIGLQPTGMRFHAGEQLRIVVTGDPEAPPLPELPSPENPNRGDHIVHTGGHYDSHLYVPLRTF